MKFLLVFAVAVALCLTVQAHPHRNSEESNESRYKNDEYNYHFDATRPSDTLRRENNMWRSQVPLQWATEVNNSPDATPFLRKFTQRLNDSNELSSKPKVREIFEELGRLKLYKCNLYNNYWEKERDQGATVALDKACAGRWLGEMMQFIASFETVSRDFPQLTAHSRNQN